MADLTIETACDWLTERYGINTTDKWEELLLDPIALARDLLLAAEAMQENAKLREALDKIQHCHRLAAPNSAGQAYYNSMVVACKNIARDALVVNHHAGSEYSASAELEGSV